MPLVGRAGSCTNKTAGDGDMHDGDMHDGAVSARDRHRRWRRSRRIVRRLQGCEPGSLSARAGQETGHGDWNTSGCHPSWLFPPSSWDGSCPPGKCFALLRKTKTGPPALCPPRSAAPLETTRCHAALCSSGIPRYPPPPPSLDVSPGPHLER
ncbi:unnamed protein product [Lampetra fluviatilis]